MRLHGLALIGLLGAAALLAPDMAGSVMIHRTLLPPGSEATVATPNGHTARLLYINLAHANPSHFRLADYQISGAELARRQICRGLPKNLHQESPEDQSFEGLRAEILSSNDGRIFDLLPAVEQLERDTIDFASESSGNESYVRGLIDDMSPIAVFIQDRTGIPASVILAQIVGESGWGGSNITIMKNNVLGLGNAGAPENFTVTLDLGDFHTSIDVHRLPGSSAYHFDTIADSIFYYVYVLTQSPENEGNYGPLREYLATHSKLALSNPEAYSRRVVELIAANYHSDPAWYAQYIDTLIDRIRPIEKSRVLGSNQAM